jgi:mRNA-degrading endonuclease RelE of RelBE toxin-antitoxin system
MAFRANFWKKLKRQIRSLFEERVSVAKNNPVQNQILKLLKLRGAEFITMATL